MTAWVTTEILRDESPRVRANKIEKLIEVAKALKQLFSFNMLYAFITGFNHCGVSRLKKTWEHVKPGSQRALNDLEELMSTMDNFRLYRKRLISVPRTVCSIPLLSLILRDIEFLNVNSAKLKNGLWNFGKLRLIKNKVRRNFLIHKIMLHCSSFPQYNLLYLTLSPKTSLSNPFADIGVGAV